MTHQNYQRIFVFISRGIGDVVMAMPLLHSLRNQLPDSEINLSVSFMQSPIAQPLQGTIVSKLTNQVYDNRIKDRLYYENQIRAFQPDLVVELSGGYRFFMAGYFLASRSVHVSKDDTRSNIGIIPIERLSSIESAHKVDRQLQLLNHLRLPTGEINFDIPLEGRVQEEAEQLIDANGLRGQRLIALMQESGMRIKYWPDDTFREVIDILTHDYGYGVVVFGKTPSGNLADKPVLDLRGRTNILTDVYLLRHACLFESVIGPDTGMMHAAGSVNSDPDGDYTANTRGNQTISLFGPTDPRRYKPYDPTGRFNLVVQPSREPFKKDAIGYATDRHSRNYMSEISVRMIIEKVQEQLANVRAA